MSPLERASGLAVRYFSGDQVRALRDVYISARTALAPAIRLVHGTFDTAALRAHLEQRIGADFEILMVHSSVNHMLPMYTGTPLELVKMLIDWCGPRRTLAMPAFYFGDPAIGGAFATFKQQPRFDLRRVPSQMGLATELFRRSPGVVQSRHPVYRVAALGPLADALTAGHEHAASPAGTGSPFDFMARHDTRVIGIGKPMQVLTQAHHAEEAMGEAFPVPRRVTESLTITVVDRGVEVPLRLTNGAVQGRFDIWKLRGLMAPGQLQEWQFHHVPMFAVRAADVTDCLLAAARRGVTLYEAHSTVDVELPPREPGWTPGAAGPASQPVGAATTTPLSIVSASAQAAFEAQARSMGLRPHHRWIGGYVDYEWEHMRHIAHALPVALAGLRVLEFGCNVGASAILYAHFGSQVSGVDITAELVELARLNAGRLGRDGIDFRCVPDTRHLPWADGEFDLVVCNSVLEYVRPGELRAVQAEIDRVLKIGGLILVTGTSSRLWPFEVHSGRWLWNYLPRIADRLVGRPIERGIWPWTARYGFGAHYDNLDTADPAHYFNRSRLSMGKSARQLNALLRLSSWLRTGPGLLTQSVSCLLHKRAAPGRRTDG